MSRRLIANFVALLASAGLAASGLSGCTQSDSVVVLPDDPVCEIFPAKVLETILPVERYEYMTEGDSGDLRDRIVKTAKLPNLADGRCSFGVSGKGGGGMWMAVDTVRSNYAYGAKPDCSDAPLPGMSKDESGVCTGSDSSGTWVQAWEIYGWHRLEGREADYQNLISTTFYVRDGVDPQLAAFTVIGMVRSFIDRPCAAKGAEPKAWEVTCSYN